MEEANARLMEQLSSVKSMHSAVLSEAQALDSDLRVKTAENEMLQAQVQELHTSLQVCSAACSTMSVCRSKAAIDTAIPCYFSPDGIENAP